MDMNRDLAEDYADSVWIWKILDTENAEELRFTERIFYECGLLRMRPSFEEK
jgi:hypothetical protein